MPSMGINTIVHRISRRPDTTYCTFDLTFLRVVSAPLCHKVSSRALGLLIFGHMPLRRGSPSCLHLPQQSHLAAFATSPMLGIPALYLAAVGVFALLYQEHALGTLMLSSALLTASRIPADIEPEPEQERGNLCMRPLREGLGSTSSQVKPDADSK